MSSELLRAIEELPASRVLVVGDLILDRYVGGDVARISPEAPIQVLRHERDHEAPGGMAAVARNLARLGAEVTVVGLVGEDDAGATLQAALAADGIETAGIVAEHARPTTVKTRFVATSQHGQQQILRVDRETVAPPSTKARKALLAAFREALKTCDMAVFSDYAKGVLATGVCEAMIESARAADVPVLIDPKGTDYERYNGATAITPNRAEAGAATGRVIRSAGDAAAAARELIESYDLDTVFVTLDRDGILVQRRGEEAQAIRTDPREVFDVTGAGDNVLATLAFSLAGGMSAFHAAVLANVAGGIAVEQFGVVTVGWDQIATRLATGSGGDAKLLDPASLERLLSGARRAGRKIVFTNGCFDVIHVGHVDLLRRSRDLGDLLVVGLNSDASVRRLKGESRPINALRARAAVLGGLASVDYVVSFEEDTPAQIIERVKPDVLVKGEDWKDKGVVGREFVESYGGRVELVKLLDGYSTTKTLEKLDED